MSPKFRFSISGMDGPQGAFECIQQQPDGRLEVLGALNRKMRIHANDDVYEMTRDRMAAAEKNQKDKW